MQKLRIYEVNRTPALAISDARDNMIYVRHYDDPAQAMEDVANWAKGGDARRWGDSDHESIDIEDFEDYLIGEMVRHEDGDIEVLDTCEILEMYL